MWPGVNYHQDDIKGKGEPSYSIEKALKDHNLDGKEEGVEMQSRASRRRGGSGDYRARAFVEEDSGVRRSGSLGNKIRKRVGSLKKVTGDE